MTACGGPITPCAARLDWKYALGLELTDPGSDASVLSEFRSRLVAGRAEYQLLDAMLAHFQACGLLKARGYLREVSDRLVKGQATTPPQIDARVGTPAEAIAEASGEPEVALVVVATHGRTGLARWFLGSVADEVLRHGSCPLLLVRPAAVHQAAGEQRAGCPAMPLRGPERRGQRRASTE